MKSITSYLQACLLTAGNGRNITIALSGFPLCILPSYEWLCVQLEQYLTHSNIYVHGHKFEQTYSQREAFRRNHLQYEECRNCTLNGICFGVKKDYLSAFPEFNLRLSKKDPEEVIASCIYYYRRRGRLAMLKENKKAL